MGKNKSKDKKKKHEKHSKHSKKEKSHKEKRKHDDSDSDDKDESRRQRTRTEPETVDKVTTTSSSKPEQTATKASSSSDEQHGPTLPKRSMVPMTKEQYEKEQSVVREELDPLTGRMRLIKGTGEVIERLVTKEQQRAINRLATLGDGQMFEATQLSLAQKFV